MAIKTKLIKIGNSQGIRIPKSILKQLNFTSEVEIDIQDNQLVLRPLATARHGWDTAFSAMAQAGDDLLLDGDTAPSQWDDAEWVW